MSENPIVEHPAENPEETPSRKTSLRKTTLRKKTLRNPHPENSDAEVRPAADAAPETPVAEQAHAEEAVAADAAVEQPVAEHSVPRLSEVPATEPPAPQKPLRKPGSMLPWAILATVFCCIPLGIVAIIKANNVDSAWRRGDYEAAYAAAKSAKDWTIITVMAGVAYMLVMVLVGLL